MCSDTLAQTKLDVDEAEDEQVDSHAHDYRSL